MTLYEYIYDVKSLIRNLNIVDEDLLTDDLIEFWIVAQRAQWIKKRDTAFISIDHSLSQTVVSEVESVDRSFIPDLVVSGYKILRTKEKLPKLINFTSWDGIMNAGPVDMAAPRFNHKEYREAVSSGYGQFNKTQIYSFLLNDYLYIISRAVKNYWFLITQVAVNGIYENPRDVGDFIHVTGDACWSPSDEYPISLDLWGYMKDQIVKGNIDMLIKVPVDNSNDDNQAKSDNP